MLSASKFGMSGALVALAGVLTVGCGSESSRSSGVPAVTAAAITTGTITGEVNGLIVHPADSLTVENGLGDAFQIAVTGLVADSLGRNVERDFTRDVTYRVTNPKVAAIGGDGLIRPVAVGNTDIEISAGEESTTIQVQVIAPQPDPTLTALSIFPPYRVLPEVDSVAGREELQQLVVVGTDDKGRLHDLTRSLGLTIQDRDNDPVVGVATITPNGLLRGFANGEIITVARVRAFALVNGAHFVLGTGEARPVDPNSLYNGAPLAGTNNPLDDAVLDNLFGQFIEPAQLASDGEFVRRLYADALGRAPSEAELAAFSGDREAEVQKVLNDAGFAPYWAGKLGEWFEMGRGNTGDQFDTWAAGQIQGGSTLASMFEDMAAGSVAPFDARHDDAAKKVDILMLAGTGMTAKCAVCHDHPLTGPADPIKWTQPERYPLDAFFAESTAEARPLDKDGVRQGNPFEPAWTLDTAVSVSSTLADPIAQRRAEFGQIFVQSPEFYRGMGHRLFAEVGRELLNPNQFLQANLDAVTVPNVLDAIAQVFETDTTLQGFLGTVFNSGWYQMTTSAVNLDPAFDGLMQRRLPKRHHSEVVDSALDVLTGADLTGNDQEFFHQTFGFPFERESISERVDAVNMSQSLLVLNSPVVQERISANGGNVAALAAEVTAGTLSEQDAVQKLFELALNREATPEELTDCMDALTLATSPREGLEDVAAALAASIEFAMR